MTAIAISVPFGLTMFVCGMLVGRNQGNDRLVGRVLAAAASVVAGVAIIVAGAGL